MITDNMCPLNLAIEVGHIQLVKMLIKAGANIHVPDAPRYPLLQAALYGRAEIADLLIRSGCRPDTCNENNECAFHLLATQSSQRFLDTCRVLLQAGAPINGLNQNGLAPLHLASREMAHLMCEFPQTDMNVVSRDGDTPLLVAAKDRREGFMVALMESDGLYVPPLPPRSGPGSCYGGLGVASGSSGGINKLSLSVESIIIQEPATYSSHRAAMNSTSTSASSSVPAGSSSSGVSPPVPTITVESATAARPIPPLDENSAAYRLGPRLNLNVQDRFGMTPLIIAADAGNSGVNMARLLLGCVRKRVVIAPSPPLSTTPPPGTLASADGSSASSADSPTTLVKEMSALMMDEKPSSVYESGLGSSYCSAAAAAELQSETTTITSTISMGPSTTTPVPPLSTTPTPSPASPSSTVTTSTSTSAALATSATYLVAIDMVDKMGMSALHHAAYVGALAMVRLIREAMLERNINSLLNLQDKAGRTPIYLATCRGHTEVVNYLLSQGADIHAANKECKSPLYISAYFGHVAISNALLRHQADVNQADSHNKTPLYVATYHGRSDIVDMLLRAGADVNTADKNGKTALYVAVLHGHLYIAEKLIEAGASVNRADKEGLAPLHMAVKFPKLDIPMVKLLLNSGCDPLNLSSFTRWLLEHNIIPEDCIERDSEFSSWLRREDTNVRSLKRLCRMEIQRGLGHTDSMKNKVKRLPLPDPLQSYVAMKAL